MLPVVYYNFEYPDVLNDTQGVHRLFNKVGKEALRQELVHHHKKRIPEHFEATNRNKYSHMPRKEGYKYVKYRKWRSRTDLVASGATKLAMTKGSPNISIGGTAAGPTGLQGKLKLKFPFTQTNKFIESQKKRYSKHPDARKKPVVGVTIDQMRKEISTINLGEQRNVAQNLRRNYTNGLQRELKSRPKIRKYFKG